LALGVRRLLHFLGQKILQRLNLKDIKSLQVVVWEIFFPTESGKLSGAKNFWDTKKPNENINYHLFASKFQMGSKYRWFPGQLLLSVEK